MLRGVAVGDAAEEAFILNENKSKIEIVKVFILEMVILSRLALLMIV